MIITLTFGFVLSLLLAVDSSLLRLLFHYLPGFSLFRSPNRFLFVAAVFGIALAGFGFDYLLKSIREKVRLRHAAAIIASVCLLAMSLEGVYYARRYLTCVPQDQVWPQVDYPEFLGVDKGLFRIATVGRSTINYGWAAPLHMQSVTGFDPYNYRHYWLYFDLMTHGRVAPEHARVWGDVGRLSRLDLLDALNVELLVAQEPLQTLPDGFALVARQSNRPIYQFYQGMRAGDLYVYRNGSVLPRVYWAESIIGASDEQTAIALIEHHNLHELTVVHDQEQKPLSFSAEDNASVEIATHHDGYLDLRIGTDKHRLLVISEIWHPGWRARLNGKPAHLLRANLALIGAWIPPGEHRLEIEFRPLLWTPGVVISLIAVVVLLLASAWLVIGRYLWNGKNTSQ